MCVWVFFLVYGPSIAILISSCCIPNNVSSAFMSPGALSSIGLVANEPTISFTSNFLHSFMFCIMRPIICPRSDGEAIRLCRFKAKCVPRSTASVHRT